MGSTHHHYRNELAHILASSAPEADNQRYATHQLGQHPNVNASKVEQIVGVLLKLVELVVFALVHFLAARVTVLAIESDENVAVSS